MVNLWHHDQKLSIRTEFESIFFYYSDKTLFCSVLFYSILFCNTFWYVNDHDDSMNMQMSISTPSSGDFQWLFWVRMNYFPVKGVYATLHVSNIIVQEPDMSWLIDNILGEETFCTFTIQPTCSFKVGINHLCHIWNYTLHGLIQNIDLVLIRIWDVMTCE